MTLRPSEAVETPEPVSCRRLVPCLALPVTAISGRWSAGRTCSCGGTPILALIILGREPICLAGLSLMAPAGAKPPSHATRGLRERRTSGGGREASLCKCTAKWGERERSRKPYTGDMLGGPGLGCSFMLVSFYRPATFFSFVSLEACIEYSRLCFVYKKCVLHRLWRPSSAAPRLGWISAPA